MRYLQTLVAFIGMVAPGLALGSPASTGSHSKLWVGGNVGLSPVGTVKGETLGVSASDDAELAFGFTGLFEYRVTPNLSIGLAPTYLLNVKPDGAMDSASVLDLPLRLAAGADVGPQLRLYGFVSPGYSIMFLPSDIPSDTQGNHLQPAGFMIGFGGGAGFKLARGLLLTGELGYQLRSLSDTASALGISVEVEGDANYLTFGLGLAAALD